MGQTGDPLQTCPGEQGWLGSGLGSSLVLPLGRNVAGSRVPEAGRLGAIASA